MMKETLFRALPEANSRPSLLQLALFSGTLVWCLAIFAPVLLGQGRAGTHASAWIRIFFSPLCHQIPERTFTLNGVHLPVCARCTGLYLGFLIGSCVAIFLKKPHPEKILWKRLLLAGAGLAALELAGSAIRLIPSLMGVRALASAPLGAVTALVTASAVSEIKSPVK